MSESIKEHPTLSKKDLVKAVHPDGMASEFIDEATTMTQVLTVASKAENNEWPAGTFKPLDKHMFVARGKDGIVHRSMKKVMLGLPSEFEKNLSVFITSNGTRRPSDAWEERISHRPGGYAAERSSRTGNSGGPFGPGWPFGQPTAEEAEIRRQHAEAREAFFSESDAFEREYTPKREALRREYGIIFDLGDRVLSVEDRKQQFDQFVEKIQKAAPEVLMMLRNAKITFVPGLLAATQRMLEVEYDFQAEARIQMQKEKKPWVDFPISAIDRAAEYVQLENFSRKYRGLGERGLGVADFQSVYERESIYRAVLQREYGLTFETLRYSDQTSDPTILKRMESGLLRMINDLAKLGEYARFLRGGMITDVYGYNPGLKRRGSAFPEEALYIKMPPDAPYAGTVISYTNAIISLQKLQSGDRR